MTETIRVAMTDDAVRLSWPKRCPACSDTKSLVSATSRVGRVKSLRPNLAGGITMRSDVMFLSFPMCRQHAGPNELANKILEKSPLMLFLRAICYVGAINALMLVGPLLTRRGAWAQLMDMGVFAWMPLVGVLGTAAVLWARRTTALWPVRFDPDMDVLEIRFTDDVYAREFKRTNRQVTDGLLTDAPPWYMRSLLWKVAVIVLFFAWMGHMINRH